MPDRLKAVNRLMYGRNVFKPGEEFIASSVDARVLVTTGLATRVDDDPVEPTDNICAPVEVREMTPETKRRGRPRKYARRDMEAA